MSAHHHMVTSAQCRAARGMLNWSRKLLANKANISERTLIDFERGARKPLRNNLRAIEEAFSSAGLHFGDDGCVCPHGSADAQ